MKKQPVKNVTQVGHGGHEQHRFCGCDVFGDLLGNETSAGLLALSVARRRISPAEAAALDDLAVAACLADPRIWPLKITRLVASYGRTLPAFGAGHMSVENPMMGNWQAGDIAAMFVDLAAAARSLNEEGFVREVKKILAQRPRLVGYGVYFRRPRPADDVPHDERVEALRAQLHRRGRTGLPYWKLFERFNEVVRVERRVSPTIAAAAAALLLDMGFTPHQVSAIAFFSNATTFTSNAFEAAEQKSETLQRLPVDSVAWAGQAPRLSPRAAGEDGAAAGARKI